MRDDDSDLTALTMTDSGYVDELAAIEDVTALGNLLGRHAGSWVSFRRDFDVSFDGTYSNHVTPEAVYALPVDRVVAWAELYGKMDRAGRFNSLFHTTGYTRRPAAVVFRPSGLVVSTETYEGFPESFERLMDFVGRNHPEVVEVAEKWRPTREQDAYRSSRSVFWMTEKVADTIVGASEYRGFHHHPDKPRVWREMMLAMGVSAFEDRACFMTGDCREQIAVFDEAAVGVLDAFENPAAAVKDDPRPSSRKRPSPPVGYKMKDLIERALIAIE